jgi:hypothetical protein
MDIGHQGPLGDRLCRLSWAGSVPNSIRVSVDGGYLMSGYYGMAKDHPPWQMVDQQSRRRLANVFFEAIVHDLRAVIRVAADNPTF